MEFCEKCGNLLIAVEEKGKLVYTCSKCGHKKRAKKVVSTNINETIRDEDKKILIFDEKDEFEQYPKAKVICPKCGNNKAYWHMQQTRAADEPPTNFYRCTKCKHSWREY